MQQCLGHGTSLSRVATRTPGHRKRRSPSWWVWRWVPRVCTLLWLSGILDVLPEGSAAQEGSTAHGCSVPVTGAWSAVTPTPREGWGGQSGRGRKGHEQPSDSFLCSVSKAHAGEGAGQTSVSGRGWRVPCNHVYGRLLWLPSLPSLWPPAVPPRVVPAHKALPFSTQPPRCLHASFLPLLPLASILQETLAALPLPR